MRASGQRGADDIGEVGLEHVVIPEGLGLFLKLSE